MFCPSCVPVSDVLWCVPVGDVVCVSVSDVVCSVVVSQSVMWYVVSQSVMWYVVSQSVMWYAVSGSVMWYVCVPVSDVVSCGLGLSNKVTKATTSERSKETRTTEPLSGHGWASRRP